MPGISGRLGNVIGNALGSTYGPTGTHREQLDIARADWEAQRGALEQAVEIDVPALAVRLEAAGFRGLSAAPRHSPPPGGSEAARPEKRKEGARNFGRGFLRPQAGGPRGAAGGTGSPEQGRGAPNSSPEEAPPT